MILVLLGISGLAAVAIAWCTARLLLAFRQYVAKQNYTAAIEAPSVSVCIPARNEMHAMTDCLERVLASDYQKMEVIVYDDSSADETSMIVRSFAHAGVRFVPGGKLPEGWLGKNHALDVLAKEASGTYLMFMDVDTKIRPSTISQLVGFAVTEKCDMVSVIPRREDTWRLGMTFEPLRYFWQLVLSHPRRPSSSPSVWMMKRHTLFDTFGGLERHKAVIDPPAVFAGSLGRGYRCLLSNAQLGVAFEKRLSSQYETSERLLYPMFGGRWWSVLYGLFVLLILNAPTFLFVAGIIVAQPAVIALALTLLLAGGGMYMLYLGRAWSGKSWLGAVVWPVVILQELILFIRSVYGHATKTLTWKGRPIQLVNKRADEANRS